MKTIASYEFNEITVIYYTNPTGGCEWVMIPISKKELLALPQRLKFDSLVQAKLVGDDFPKGFATGSTMRNGQTVKEMSYVKQTVAESESQLKVVTTLQDAHKNLYHHHMIADKESGIVETYVVFENQSDQPQTIEMLSSVSLSNLSPFNEENQPGNLLITRYRSKWSFEGRKEQNPIEEYQLEPSWKPSGVGLEKFGQVGSMPVRNYFPTAAITDQAANVTWGVRLAHPGSWQGEFYRLDEDLCFAMGIADRDYGDWSKTIAPGDSFETPHAFMTVCEGDEEVCGNQLNRYFSALVSNNNHPTEEAMSVMFNEFCTTWGRPSESSVTEAIPYLQKHQLDYYVIDCGWYADPVKGWEKNMGDWLPNKEQFPHGVKAVVDQIREAGLLPGIWFEIETVGRDAVAFSLVDHLLKKDGVPITTGDRRFWDMNDPWVIDYLTEKVIGFLKEIQVGYLKIDYNDNFGVGFDGSEAFGEENRKQLQGTQAFFDKIRQAMPELIIENCSSGGHRLEPSFMMRTDLSSFSDAHESLCIPIIGANMQELIPARQNLMWAVLRKEDSLARLYYSMTANLLGRLCLSGDITELSAQQWQVVDEGVAFYRQVSAIIKDGDSYRFGAPVLSYRKPTGNQAVVRYSFDQQQALVVAHNFAQGEKLTLPLNAHYEIVASYHSADFTATLVDNQLTLTFAKDFTGGALHLKKVN